MFVSLILSVICGIEPNKPITIEIDGKKYRAVIVEEIKEVKPKKKEKLVWMELNGVPIQVTEEDYEGRFDKPEEKHTNGWNYYLDKPRLTIKERNKILKRLHDKPSDPLYNFTSDELQAMDEKHLKPGEDYGRAGQFDPKKTDEYSYPSRFSSLEQYHSYLANPDADKYRHLRGRRVEKVKIKEGPGEDD